LVGAVLGAGAAAAVAQRRAQTAADLGALAGARAHADGGDGCAAAAGVVAANGSTVETCSLLGPDLLLDVSGSVGDLLGGLVEVHAQARAGPGG
ncbi:Rv3654c family TadE-like protein, partial [Nocardioides bruguierae]